MLAGPNPVRCGQIQKAIPYRLDRHRFRTIYTVRVGSGVTGSRVNGVSGSGLETGSLFSSRKATRPMPCSDRSWTFSLERLLLALRIFLQVCEEIFSKKLEFLLSEKSLNFCSSKNRVQQNGLGLAKPKSLDPERNSAQKTENIKS